MKTITMLGLLGAMTLAVGGACYVASLGCLCVTAGQCYGQQTPNGCQVPTCIIADVNGYGPNVCEGQGPYNARQPISSPTTTCIVPRCRIYNSCTHQYETPPQGCNFTPQNYQGIPGSCL